MSNRTLGNSSPTSPSRRARIGILVVSHGDTCYAMVEAAERMVGSLGVSALAVRIGEAREETAKRIETACQALDADEILFLVDLEGSTPYNLCCGHRGSSVILSGMNLPMLFKLATADRTRGATALAEALSATGRKSIHIHQGSR
jgi:mannose/fructose-specific phosphotransferase system component IIA